jgi:hypothetical protein
MYLTLIKLDRGQNLKELNRDMINFIIVPSLRLPRRLLLDTCLPALPNLSCRHSGYAHVDNACPIYYRFRVHQRGAVEPCLLL